MVRIIKKDAYKICFKIGGKKMSKIKKSDLIQKRSNTGELVDSNFNQLSFIQALGAEALVKGVGDKVPNKNGGIGKK